MSNPFAKKEEKMTIVELLNTLQTKVAETEAKLATFQESEKARDKASKEYSESLAEVEKLKTELQEQIGTIFPTGAVRQYN